MYLNPPGGAELGLVRDQTTSENQTISCLNRALRRWDPAQDMTPVLAPPSPGVGVGAGAAPLPRCEAVQGP